MARCRRRSGFTLIELLVVIAIIGILAAMLFPVFARARESARKTQCLANVKNIAMAIQIYLTDYDGMPPGNHDATAQAFWDTEPGKGGGGSHSDCGRGRSGNPFLRFAVVFDEYTKSREVWTCPSQKMPATFANPLWIVPQYTTPWWSYLEQNIGKWGTGLTNSPCSAAYPPGWGGTTTDSIAQQKQAAPNAYVWITGPGEPSAGAFDPGIGCYESSQADAKTSQMNDTANYVVVGDLGVFLELNSNAHNLWYACRQGCGADWVNCSWTQACSLSPDQVDRFASDASFRAKYTKHMGGSNFGFADGHAKWFPAETWNNLAPRCECCSSKTNYTDSYIYTAKDGAIIEGTCFAP